MPARAQSPQPPLAQAQILITGLAAQPNPATQVVPENIHGLLHLLGWTERFQRSTADCLRTFRGYAVRAYDVDGDGRPEPVFLDDRGLVIWRNLGQRRFDTMIVPDAKGARDFAMADLNRDGKLDLVLSGDPGRIVFGDGPLRFAFERAVKLPTQHARGCETADLDGDGYADVVFSNHDDGDTFDIRSYIYWNGPDGFSAGRRQELPANGANSVAIGDADGDGRPDLLILNARGGHVSRTPTYIYFGNAKGEYTTTARRVIETPGANDGASADFNDDGYTDLVLTQNIRMSPQELLKHLRPGFRPPLEADGKVEVQPVYWGAPDAFQTLKTTYLPMFGSYGAPLPI